LNIEIQSLANVHLYYGSEMGTNEDITCALP
jgi:hypothetical protein